MYTEKTQIPVVRPLKATLSCAMMKNMKKSGSNRRKICGESGLCGGNGDFYE